MPLTLQGLRTTCYDPINFTPRTVAVPGAAANVIKFDPYDQVAHSFAPLTGNIENIKFVRVSGGDSYYLPFQSDAITSVSLPVAPDPANFEPIYFFTIRLTACAIFIDDYQPTAAAGYTTPLGQADTRPRLIISHAN